MYTCRVLWPHCSGRVLEKLMVEYARRVLAEPMVARARREFVELKVRARCVLRPYSPGYVIIVLVPCVLAELMVVVCIGRSQCLVCEVTRLWRVRLAECT